MQTIIPRLERDADQLQRLSKRKPKSSKRKWKKQLLREKLLIAGWRHTDY
ncbi:MAG: hypothetical protein V4563_14865 [Pseudomonadota bacterium]